jgi:hypothetical protein
MFDTRVCRGREEGGAGRSRAWGKGAVSLVYESTEEKVARRWDLAGQKM